jgi:hypothetical protein
VSTPEAPWWLSKLSQVKWLVIVLLLVVAVALVYFNLPIDPPGGDTKNDPPVAVPDAYVFTADAPLIDAARGVLANDTDPEGDALKAELVKGPDKGTLKLNADGSFTYTPNPGFSGEDSFTYRALDGRGRSATAKAQLLVSSISSPPISSPPIKPLIDTGGEDGRIRTQWVGDEGHKHIFVLRADGKWLSSDDGREPRQVWTVTGITQKEIRLLSSNDAGPIYGILTSKYHYYCTPTTEWTPVPGRFR